MALREEFQSQGNFLFKYRSFLPVLVLVPALIMSYNNAREKSIRISDTYFIVSYAVALIGVLIRVYTVGYSAKNTSGRNTTEGQVADSLNQKGIYSICRHPLYLGNFFMWLGVTLLTHHFWFIMFFIVLFWFYYERIMYAEEQFLSTKFGEAYTHWASRTPAVIPAPEKWIGNIHGFQISKVIQNEKAGLLYLNLLFFVFHSLYNKTGFFAFERSNAWSVLFYATLLYYVVVKLTSKASRWFGN